MLTACRARKYCVMAHLQERLVGASQAHNAPAAATSSRKSNHQGVWSEQEQLMGAPHAADGLSDGQTGKCTELRPHDCESHRILCTNPPPSEWLLLLMTYTNRELYHSRLPTKDTLPVAINSFPRSSAKANTVTCLEEP